MNQSTESRLISGVVLLGTLALAGCEGESRPFQEAVEVQLSNVRSVAVVPPAMEAGSPVEINQAQKVQFTVTGNSAITPDEDVDTSVPLEDKDRSWRSSDNNIVTVTDRGLVTGIAEGDAIITVSIGGVFSSFPVKVQNAELVSFLPIAFTDGNESVERCLPENFYALGTYTDQSTRPVYDAVYSLTADSATTASVATMGNMAQLTATTAGAVTLNVSSANGKSIEPMIVVGDTLQADSIAIVPGIISINEDKSIDLQATATYGDSPAAEGEDPKPDTRNITQSVSWNIIEGAEAAEIANEGENKGRLSGKNEGSGKVTASCGPDSSGEVNFTITPVDNSDSKVLSFEFPNNTLTVNLTDADTQLEVKRGSEFNEGDLQSTTNLIFTVTSQSGSTIAIDQNDLNNGIIDPIAVGTVLVTVTLRDDSDVTGSFTVIVEEE